MNLQGCPCRKDSGSACRNRTIVRDRSAGGCHAREPSPLDRRLFPRRSAPKGTSTCAYSCFRWLSCWMPRVGRGTIPSPLGTQRGRPRRCQEPEPEGWDEPGASTTQPKGCNAGGGTKNKSPKSQRTTCSCTARSSSPQNCCRAHKSRLDTTNGIERIDALPHYSRNGTYGQ
jgi:hypothetical protein